MCTHKSSDGLACGRNNINGTDYCVVHYGWDLSPEKLKSLPPNDQFQKTFDELIANGNGNWKGFVFAAGTVFPDQIAFAVLARECRFESLELNNTIFQAAADFAESVFYETTEVRRALFRSSVTFERCRFNGPVSFLNVIHEGAASFHRAEFGDRTIIRSNFASTANLNEAVFRGAVSFAGWRNVTATVNAGLGIASSAIGHGVALGGKPPTVAQRIRTSINAAWRLAKDGWHRSQRVIGAGISAAKTRYRLAVRRYSTIDPNTRIFRVFEGDGQLQGVIFMRPEQTSFSQLDLSNVYVKGTNFNGIRFLAVTWWQPTLRRNGLRDEFFIRMSPDGPFRYLELPALEETCRNVRVALEESRSFNLASDFYIAEMEAARARLSFMRRHFFSVSALYLWTSRYGTSVGQAIRVFAELLILYVGLTLLLKSEPKLIEDMAEAFLQSFGLLVFQSEHDIAAGAGQAWLDTAFRVLGLIQVTMLVFAFRSRIKRS